MKIAVLAYLSIVALMSLVSFAAFGWDKRSAEAGKRRVPEQTLHTLAFLGGWPGALVGQSVFRHKTKKLSFRIVLWAIILLHALVVIAAYVAISKFAATQ